jgi:hypothetical protein
MLCKRSASIDISSSLPENPVRFKEGHKRTDFCVNQLVQHVSDASQ